MRNLLILILLTTLAFGCNTKTKKENKALKAELETMVAENAIFAAESFDMAIKVDEYQSMLQEIDKNIAAIDVKNNKVKTLTSGNEKAVEDDILLHVEHVHKTMENTKHKIKYLQENLDELYLNAAIDEGTILQLESQLDYAADEILNRDIAIDDLNDEIIDQGYDMAALTDAYNQQAALSDAIYSMVNTAYIFVGTKKDLETHGLVNISGSYIGTGKVKRLAAENETLFTAIPIDATDMIELSCKKAKLLSAHPKSSYNLEGDDMIENLVILDKGAFWNKSDFLVIKIVK
jgi:hypothetical protein